MYIREKSILGGSKDQLVIVYQFKMNSYIIAIEFVKESFCGIPKSPYLSLIPIERFLHGVVAIIHGQGKAILTPYPIGMN